MPVTRRPIGTAFAALAAALAGLIALAALSAPSSSAAAPKRCPGGNLCVWTKSSYEGKRLLISNRELSNKIANARGGVFNDNVSSLKLRKSGTAILFADVAGQGQRRCFFNRTNAPNLSKIKFDDVASSSKIPRGNTPSSCSS